MGIGAPAQESSRGGCPAVSKPWLRCHQLNSPFFKNVMFIRLYLSQTNDICPGARSQMLPSSPSLSLPRPLRLSDLAPQEPTEGLRAHLEVQLHVADGETEASRRREGWFLALPWVARCWRGVNHSCSCTGPRAKDLSRIPTHLLRFPDDKTETGRGEVTCLRPQGSKEEGL